MTARYDSIDKSFSPLNLIEEVKKRPGLYETGPKDRIQRLKLWKEIGSVLFPNWGSYNKAHVYHIECTEFISWPLSVLQLQRKWRSLRDAYNRELRSRRSGNRIHHRVYIYFKKMSFLGGFEGTLSEEDDTANDTTDHEPLNNGVAKPKAVRPKAKKRRQIRMSSADSSAPPPEEVEMPIFSNAEIPKDMEADTDRLFLLSFLPEMRQLPINIKMWTRAQIANVMQEAVGCHYNNCQPGTFTTEREVKRQRRDSSD